MTHIPVALLVGLSIGTAAAVVLALLFLRSHQETRRQRSRAQEAADGLRTANRQHAELTARIQSTEAEVRHLAASRIPDLAASLSHPNVPVRGPLDASTADTPFGSTLSSVLEQVSDAVTKERLRVDSAAQAAMRGASTTMQALLYQLQTRLQEMQEKYEDPQIAEDLLAADFLNEQALRRIQSTAVVCGAWPGLTRQNSHLSDIVVGAVSRLSGYERVQVTSHLRDPVGVVARAVEPVAVTLTELIANALHFSHPELPVAVALQQGNRGASVIIDDAGVGMHEDELGRAARLMSGEDAVLLTELGDPPRTGFAAIGQLVRQYGFTTHVEASPYGGVRAIVHIPGDPLLTLLDEAEQPTSAMAPVPAGGAPRLTGGGAEEQGGAESSRSSGSSGSVAPEPGPVPAPAPASGPRQEPELPRRRRRRPVEQDAAGEAQGTGAHRAAPASAAPESSGPGAAPEESAARWAAFQQGTASGRAAADTSDGITAPAHGAGAGAAGEAPPHEPRPQEEHPHYDPDPRSTEGNPPA
ncbi:sensor histidine kinase [Streptomyces sp. ODS28]|uniref:sensor histidine kinase n=1 Tax=Streptomyces sp. ODS28 TaxID=3136688 RepID=UPI0031EF7B6A